MRRMSVDDVGVTLTSLFSSRVTPARRHNFVINTGNGKDVWCCLALMAISYSIMSPKLMLFLAMVDMRHAVFG
ncbi:hypothetical protein H5410_022442 [Solanum commersonii]|uniref:Uncharacterized protein n=1 Tax=Solanum commersonii TaxID=4109 RepID=A0A9J5ZE61_SOLCO|nr:hypothetical protein H5410_022442 [Solanum commersonii]